MYGDGGTGMLHTLSSRTEDCGNLADNGTGNNDTPKSGTSRASARLTFAMGITLTLVAQSYTPTPTTDPGSLATLEDLSPSPSNRECQQRKSIQEKGPGGG